MSDANASFPPSTANFAFSTVGMTFRSNFPLYRRRIFASRNAGNKIIQFPLPALNELITMFQLQALYPPLLRMQAVWSYRFYFFSLIRGTMIGSFRTAPLVFLLRVCNFMVGLEFPISI